MNISLENGEAAKTKYNCLAKFHAMYGQIQRIKQLFKTYQHKQSHLESLLVYDAKNVNLYKHYPLETFDEIFNYDAQNPTLDTKTADLFTFPIVLNPNDVEKILKRPKVAVYSRDKIKEVAYGGGSKGKVYTKQIFLLDKNKGEHTPNLYVLSVDMYNQNLSVTPNLAFLTNTKMDNSNVVFGISLHQIISGDKKLGVLLARTDLGKHSDASLAHLHVPDANKILTEPVLGSIMRSIKHCDATQIVNPDDLPAQSIVPISAIIKFALQKYNVKNLNSKTLEIKENFINGCDNISDIILSGTYNEAMHEYCDEPYHEERSDMERFEFVLRDYFDSLKNATKPKGFALQGKQTSMPPSNLPNEVDNQITPAHKVTITFG